MPSAPPSDRRILNRHLPFGRATAAATALVAGTIVAGAIVAGTIIAGAIVAGTIIASSLAWAQLPGIGAGLRQHPLQRNEPVTFTADKVTYDRDANTVTATGHVEAWQDDHVVRADKVVYDRNTNVVAAYGNVVLLEPDGEVLFANYAELSQGMRDAVMRGMRAILAANAKMAANGGRRIGGEVNELSRVIYSPCNLCKNNPSAPPEWDVRAFSVTQDLENKRIYFEDAVLDMYGIPVAYTPYFSIPDPSVKRQSGFLTPSLGNNSLLGAFASLPYYWVIGKSADATFIPTLDTRGTGQLDMIYRQRFNDGTMRIDVAGAYDEGAFQGLFFAKGSFDLNDEWRYGFDVNEASSANYLRDFRLQGYGQNQLTSTIYAEGFGQGAYSRADVLFYQGLVSSVDDKQLPYVLPRYTYDYFGDRDALGGRWEVIDTGAFNVFRIQGTTDQRAGGIVQYELPEVGRLGDVWNIRLRLAAEAYNSFELNQAPNFSRVDAAVAGQAMPTAAAMVKWPFLRPGGDWGSQLIEPIVQLVARPNNGETGYYRLPNEDSLDLIFSDMNLFALNRFPGIDRQEGGSRADVGLHAAWYAPSGNDVFDALVGQSYNSHREVGLFPPLSGLNDWVSDVVARAYVAPTSWLDLTARTRIDHRNYDIRFADATAAVGPPNVKFTLGYLFSATDPYYALDTPPGQIPTESYFQPRNELTLGVSTKYGHWKIGGFARRDLEHNEMVAIGGNAAYEDECLIAALNFFRLYTNYNGISDITGVTLTFTFKTLGKFGFSAL
jgi:LPS-assembly protein